VEGGSIMSWQKCPICNGTGIEPLSGTSTNTQARCLVCDGRRIINKKTGLPPNRISIEKVVREMPKIVKDAQINYATQEHVKNVIDELDKTGELPYHIRPTNALKRTEQEKEKIRLERLVDPTLHKIDEESGRDIFDNLEHKPTQTST
jgi:predicted patatin/cPLA2 family phospholipase